MNNDCELMYKTSRKNADKTQEKAAEEIGVEVRQLSNYENGHARVPEDVLMAMVRVYNDLELFWWHLKYKTAYGEFLPDIVVAQSDSEATLKAILAHEGLAPYVETMKKHAVGELTCAKLYKEAVDGIARMKAKLFSVVLFTKKKDRQHTAM